MSSLRSQVGAQIERMNIMAKLGGGVYGASLEIKTLRSAFEFLYQRRFLYIFNTLLGSVWKYTFRFGLEIHYIKYTFWFGFEITLIPSNTM